MKRAILSLINNSEVKQKEYPNFPDILKILSKGEKGSKDFYNIFKGISVLKISIMSNWIHCSILRKFLLEMWKMAQKIKGLYIDSNIELIVECNIPTNRCEIYVFVYCTKRKEIWYQFEHRLPSQCNKILVKLYMYYTSRNCNICQIFVINVNH